MLHGAADGLCRSFGLHGTLATFGGPGRDCQERVRHTVGDDAYAAAVRRGGELTTAEVIAYTLEEPPGTARSTPATAPPPTSLTRRETQVAALIAEGMSNKQIAARLVISQRTAETHVERILVKLGFTKRTQVAAWTTTTAQVSYPGE